MLFRLYHTVSVVPRIRYALSPRTVTNFSYRSRPSRPFSAMTTDSTTSWPPQEQQSSTDQQQNGQVDASRALPAPGDANVTTLDVSGEGTTVKLDHLGPMVVNTDGTMSRVANWEQMTKIERENTLRVLGRRNQARLKVLREAREQEAKSGSGNA